MLPKDSQTGADAQQDAGRSDVSPTASTLPPPKTFTGHTASDFTVPERDPLAETQPMSPPPWPDNPLVPEPFEMAVTVGEEGCA